MLRNRLARVAVAATAASLVLPAGAAQAAPKPPDVPRLSAVAKIYPHLADGQRAVYEQPVRINGLKCDVSRPEARAAGVIADYEGETARATRSKPAVLVHAMKFASRQRAELFSTRFKRYVRRCGKEFGETRNVRIPVDIGRSSWGRSVTLTSGGREHGNIVAARTGKRVVVAMAVSTGARPPVPGKTVRLAELALRVATR